MADKNSNILNLLQEFEISPSAFAFEKAWDNILLQKQDTGNSDETSAIAFSKLQNFSMPAPSIDLSAIIAGKKFLQPKKAAPFISKNILRVAAVLAIAITGLIIYKSISTNNSDHPADKQFASGKGINSNGQTGKEPFDSAQNNELSTGNTSLNATNAEKALSSKNSNKNKNTSGLLASEKNSKKGGKKNMYGKPGSFYNNDFFLTLVNYTEYGKDKLFTKTLKEKKITLNQYSYVNLSDKMVEMLQEIYITKKNGKPSRKAKKAKKKFEKWRAGDEEYFDKNINKNPADIIDLSEFLMNN